MTPAFLFCCFSEVLFLINTTAPLAFAACAARTTAACAALWLLFSAPACAQESSEPGSSTEPPFSYPATLLSARSTYTVSPATPVLLGNTVVVIEHNMDVIAGADWVIDIGPEGGGRGGELIFEGVPEDLVKCKASITGQWLKKTLDASKLKCRSRGGKLQ